MRDRARESEESHIPPGFTITTSCGGCGGELELAFELALTFDRLTRTELSCPYCGQSTQIATGRRLLWVSESPVYQSDRLRVQH